MNLQEYINKYGNIKVEEKKLNEFLGIEKIWKPQICEKFWSVNALGDVAESCWQTTSCTHEALWLMGNVFKTKEEAEFAAEKRKVEVELQRYTDRHNKKIDWNNPCQNKYYFYYSYINKRIQITCDNVVQCGQVHFTSREIAEEAIQAIGENRLKKYYFECEEV